MVTSTGFEPLETLADARSKVARFAVIVQSDDLMLSTVLVAPTSRSAPPRILRATIVIDDEQTQVLVEQTAVDESST